VVIFRRKPLRWYNILMKALIKKRRNELKEGLREEFSQLGNRLGREAVLVSLALEADPSSEVYRNSIKKKGESLGVRVKLMEGNREDLRRLNRDPGIDGIIIHCRRENFLEYSSLISPEKDVEGITPLNLGRLVRGEDGPRPATPLAVMEILKVLNFPLEGKMAVIVGRSIIVGKPLIFLLLAENATVATAHSRTKPLERLTSQADLLVVAAGRPHLIKPSMVKEGAVVVDVGINVVDGKITGDVDPQVKEKALLTPVPGGVGTFTPLMLFSNLALLLRRKLEGKTSHNSD